MDKFKKLVNIYNIRNRPDLHFHAGQSVLFSGYLSENKKYIPFVPSKEKIYRLKILVIYSSPSLHKIELRTIKDDSELDEEFQHDLDLDELKSAFSDAECVERLISMLNQYSTKQS